MSSWRVLLWALTAPALGAPLSVARAQGEAGADEAKEKAKAAFGRGRAAYEGGRYAEALAAFQEANAIKPHPLMLFNIAQVHEAMNNLPAALSFYEQFLATNPKDKPTIEAKVASIKRTLQTAWSTVELSTDPPGAQVWVGKKEGPSRGETPLTLQIPAGPQTLLLEKAGFETVTRPLKLEAGKSTTLGVALPPQQPVLTVRSTPPGAEVLVDGVPVGQTPVSHAAPAGAHRVEVKLAGHAPDTREVTLGTQHTPAAPMAIEVTLAKQAATGQLALFVDRPGAQVKLNGEAVGIAPFDKPLDLPEGVYKLEVMGDAASEPYSEMVTISAGQVTRSRVELGEEGGGGFDQRTVSYVVMGGGGALLVGGLVTGVLAMSADGDLQDCRDDSACVGTQSEVDFADEVRSKALITDVLVGAGLVAAGTGVVLFFLSDDAPAGGSEAGRPTLGIVPTADGGAAAFGRMSF